jgi:PKD repeat protein
MSRNNLNIEDLFRTQMDSYKVDPSPGLWKKVQTQILWKQFLSFSLQTFNVYYLVAAVTLAGIGGYLLLSPPADKIADQTYQSAQELTNDNTSASSIEKTGNESITEGKESTLSKNEAPENQIRVNRESDAEVTEDGTIGEEGAAGRESEEIGNQENESESKENNAKKSEIVVVKAGFSASHLEGCSPLAVTFENTSENAIKYAWIFSDGGSSAEKDPSYVFDEPGMYPVLLKIKGSDGLEYTTQQTIQVFESPKALFEMDDVMDLSNNQPVYFYNYSRGAEYFKWDFGDNQQSILAEPIHFYDQPGSYNVKLKVWTENQCFDSLIIHNAFTGPESKISFPNAFTPNMSGPTGGYYEINDFNNTIFHPVISGHLIEYQLKIFNRHGLQIFESNDISYGWDGYYQEKLAAQAVYIWRARGKFSNGKTFVKSGDITLIRQY